MRVRNVRPRPRTLAAVTALTVCLIVPLGREHHEYIRTVLWGGAILASAVGWGAIVANRLYGKDARVGWGLEAALGMAVHLALGGLLAMLSLVSAATCYVAVTLGVVLFAFEAWRRAEANVGPPASDSEEGMGSSGPSIAGGVVVLVLGVAVLHYLAHAAVRTANIFDDYQAYFVFPKQLLATGTLIEPFSSRRIDAYGGQSYLQALVLAFSTVSRIGVLDNGICVLVLAGLAVGWVRERRRLPLVVGVLAVLALITLPYFDIYVIPKNAGSELSGAVFFLAIFRVLDRSRRPDESAWANALALALVASAACTLRQTNLPAAVLIPAFYYVARMMREGDARRRWAQETALAVFFSLALLLPWMVLAYRSCGTPLYPLILGNSASSYVRFEPISALERARYFLMATGYPARLPGLVLALTAGLVVPCRASLALRASLVGSALAMIVIVNALAPTDVVDATDRYIFPFGLAYFLAVSLVAARGVVRPTIAPGRSVTALALVVAAVVLQLGQTHFGASYAHTTANTLGQSYVADMDAVEGALRDPWPTSHLVREDAAYLALQRTVPEHATLLVILDQPFRLDFRRNRIFSWDQPGAVSPPPHLPIGQGSDALARYLLGQGVRYVAYCYGTSPHYNHSWLNLLRGTVPPHDGMSAGPVLRNLARAYVDIFANLQKLTATRKQLYDHYGTYVLDLATPASAPV
jgi:hypothetical protein